ncbi:WFDC3 [Mytilus coruscus]|uniref:WFDC3 n=1 Tax=Mytilus coruscus TaxID=42192 RepID=A0A6J7ZYX1_MYTCO|nr:WFDC3 [Mytilus coruscus]
MNACKIIAVLILYSIQQSQSANIGWPVKCQGAMDCDVCPPPGIGLCVELGGCPTGQLLCFNGCGHTCFPPVKDTQPASNNYCGPCETRLLTTAPQYWCNSCEEVNNIDKVIENRERNKEKISNKKSRSDIQILRKKINKHLDNLESQLATQSYKIIEDENEKLENILQRLKEKKRNVTVLRNKFSE